MIGSGPSSAGSTGPSAHLAEQVVAKARLPLVCPVSSDRTANVANVPWMFSVLPGDNAQAPCLAEVPGRDRRLAWLCVCLGPGS